MKTLAVFAVLVVIWLHWSSLRIEVGLARQINTVTQQGR